MEVGRWDVYVLRQLHFEKHCGIGEGEAEEEEVSKDDRKRKKTT